MNLLVEYLKNVNHYIKQPLQCTQRIKFTCFDVSHKFLVFGATSGAVYIYKLESCAFIKLIPTKEGAVCRICIAPDEKTIALASSKGSVVIIENGLMESNVECHIFLEHKGSLVTAMKWNGEELYCGDNKGMLSGIALPKLLTKNIFTMPCALLMDLDSSIVQIDCVSTFLLISTHTRTYICKTDKEQYQQIGKQLRLGSFGACFLYKDLRNDDLKIFCSRPGARIWVAEVDGLVIQTHEFKNSFKTVPKNFLQFTNEAEVGLNVITVPNAERLPESYNFSKLLVLKQKFLLSFNKNEFYIFDTESSKIVIWCNLYNEIEDIRIIDNFIYIWKRDYNMHIVALYDLEELILKTLHHKQYSICGELCIKYVEDIRLLITISRNIHTILILKEKLSDDNVLKKLTQLFQDIQDSANKYTRSLTTIAETIKETTEKNIQKIDNSSPEPAVTQYELFQRQYQLSNINDNLETPGFHRMLLEHSLDVVVNLFRQFQEDHFEEERIATWCYWNYLKYLYKNDYETEIEKFTLQGNSLKYTFEAFCTVNDYTKSMCQCSFALPSAKENVPKFYEIGCALLRRLWVINCVLCEELCERVSFMWMYLVKELQSENNLTDLLPRLIQFSDENLITYFSHKFTYDTWDNAARLLLKLKDCLCLNCECGFQTEHDSTIKWNNFAMLMLQSMGAPNTIKLLTRYSNVITSTDLNMNFYQSCIYTAIMNKYSKDERNKALVLSKKFQTEKDIALKLENIVSEFLQNEAAKKVNKKYLRNNSKSIVGKCSFCNLSTAVQVLKSDSCLKCRRPRHDLSLLQNKNVCFEDNLEK